MVPETPDERPESGQQKCRFIDRCPMFPLFSDDVLLRAYKDCYCHAAFEECERFKWASAGEMPDPKLLPDGSWLSEEV